MRLPIPAAEPIKVLAMAIQAELGLKDGQIMLGLENWEIPENTGLYVSLIYGPDQVVGNNSQNSLDDQGSYVEVKSAVMLHTIEVDIMSFDSSARTMKEQVLWALQSYNSQQLMQKYQMRLAQTPSAMVPVPSLEPSKQLNRFRFSVAVNALHQKAQATPYYDALQKVGLVENA